MRSSEPNPTVTPSAKGCEECLAIGDTWVQLRLCLTCGHVGCCDSSKNKHATYHEGEPECNALAWRVYAQHYNGKPLHSDFHHLRRRRFFHIFRDYRLAIRRKIFYIVSVFIVVPAPYGRLLKASTFHLQKRPTRGQDYIYIYKGGG